MGIIFALAAAVFIAFVFSYSPRIGAMLVIIAVLGLWLTAKKKGMV